jgi:hypothetical protein
VRQRVDAEGAATAIDAVGAGGAMPLPDSEDGTTAAYAAADALLCLRPRHPPRTGMDASGPASAQVVALYAAALDRVERITQARSRPSALGRVASLLCTLADTLSLPRRLTFVPAALQQRDLAALLSMRHESVCRAVQTLVRQGVVSRREEGIRLLDRSRLEAAQSL